MSVEATCPTNGITIPADEGDRSPVQKGMDATNAQVSDIAAQLGRSGRENMPIQRARHNEVVTTMPANHVVDATMLDGGPRRECHGT